MPSTDDIDATRQPIVTIRDGEVFASSRNVAAFFAKNHRDVLRAIDTLLEQAPELGVRNFAQGSYTLPETGSQAHRCFDMDRDGFSLLAMGFTGTKALKWKLRYIDAFNAMEAELRRQAQPRFAELPLPFPPIDQDALDRLQKKLVDETESSKRGILAYVKTKVLPPLAALGDFMDEWRRSSHTGLQTINGNVLGLREEFAHIAKLAEPKISPQTVNPSEWFFCADIYDRLAPGVAIPKRSILSQNIKNSLDSYCKHRLIQHCARLMNGQCWWHKEAVLPWWGEIGREMVDRHIARHADSQNVIRFPNSGRPEEWQ